MIRGLIVANPPMTQEERLAREIYRCEQIANELGFPSTAGYLSIAFKKLANERAEKMSALADRGIVR